jgi:hypothetical protein
MNSGYEIRKLDISIENHDKVRRQCMYQLPCSRSNSRIDRHQLKVDIEYEILSSGAVTTTMRVRAFENYSSLVQLMVCSGNGISRPSRDFFAARRKARRSKYKPDWLEVMVPFSYFLFDN